MAFFAGYSGMFAFEFVASEFVIELLQGGLPANQVKGFAVMFQVAMNAVFSRGIAHLHFEVVTVFRGEILRNFLVAVEALKCGRAGAERVTGIALRSPC